MPYSFFLALGLFAINVLTPGASFVMTVSNAMNHGRRSGVFVALGLTTADVMFAVMATAGLAALLSRDVMLLNAISFFGGVWFAYGGIRLILKHQAVSLPLQSGKYLGSLPVPIAYRLGFMAGAVNAQAIIFFSTIFTIAGPATSDPHEAIALVAGVVVVSALTRSSVVQLFTTDRVMRFYAAQRRKIETLSGGMLAAFGMKLGAPAAVMLSHYLIGIR